jgi:hypothetical protein
VFKWTLNIEFLPWWKRINIWKPPFTLTALVHLRLGSGSGSGPGFLIGSVSVSGSPLIYLPGSGSAKNENGSTRVVETAPKYCIYSLENDMLRIWKT